MTCVLNDRFHEKGTALAAVPQQAEPEIGSLAGSSPDSGGTATAWMPSGANVN